MTESNNPPQVTESEKPVPLRLKDLGLLELMCKVDNYIMYNYGLKAFDRWLDQTTGVFQWLPEEDAYDSPA